MEKDKTLYMNDIDCLKHRVNTVLKTMNDTTQNYETISVELDEDVLLELQNYFEDKIGKTLTYEEIVMYVLYEQILIFQKQKYEKTHPKTKYIDFCVLTKFIKNKKINKKLFKNFNKLYVQTGFVKNKKNDFIITKNNKIKVLK